MFLIYVFGHIRRTEVSYIAMLLILLCINVTLLGPQLQNLLGPTGPSYLVPIPPWKNVLACFCRAG